MKILIKKIFWYKYVIFYISLYRNPGNNFHELGHLYISHTNLWTDFHTCHMKFFIFNIRKSWPRYLFKNMEIFYASYMKAWVPIFPDEIWNSLYILLEIGPSIYINIKYLCITYEHLCSNFLRVSIEHYVYHRKTWVPISPHAFWNYVYLRYLSNSVY